MVGPQLVVMAAGIGSRYGGLKQVDPVGPSGEIVLDYAVYDAIRAGFAGVVFVIRRDIEEVFREKVGRSIEGRLDTRYVFQDLAALPPPYTVPEGRTKPWGTGHAVLSAAQAVTAPFAVINADDYYGQQSFQVLADHLRAARDSGGVYDFSMVAFRLENTVTEHGHVARGVCTATPDGRLASIVERTRIETSAGAIRFTEDAGATWTALPADTPVSMNMWGFTPDFFREAQAGFARFLTQIRDPQRTEYYLPSAVQEMMDQGKATVEVLASDDRWLGVTYPEDKPLVRAGLQRLIDAGVYPPSLWG